ncbi:hypothetical protein MMC13_005742 [Lambiella insularis]|nr:hypothetical protein [Lambiella insularis]
MSNIILNCKKCTHGNKVSVEFTDAEFTFHAQWLHDARCDDGPSKNATTAICQQPLSTVHVERVRVSGQGVKMALEVTWDDGLTSKFPAPWLRVMAPLVAKAESTQTGSERPKPKGWLVDSLKIPEISYHDIARKDLPQKEHDLKAIEILDKILDPSLPGIVKVVGLPKPNVSDERNHINNINTKVLKDLFGSVFIHPIRGTDKTFNVSSHGSDATRALGVPNYDTTQLLLPHSDHAFYDTPIQAQGFYILEGTSLNTWVSIPAALATLETEAPHLLPHLHTAPMAVGRVSRFYGAPLYQATVDTPITSQPGSPDQLKRFRWHPNLTGSLLAPYDAYADARLAHQTFQAILRRPTHQLTRLLAPGDLYVWDNFRLLHGREQVLQVPRTGVGQCVPEQVVHDRYRALCVGVLREWVGEDWLVHMPMPQLREMLRLVEGGV